MDERDVLAARFEENRTHLRAVAYRMLGSLSEAEDAVQETWLRLNRADASDVENLGGWLTTVISRVCLDTLRSRKSRREELLSSGASEPPMAGDDGVDLEQEMLLAESVGLALLVVLDALPPAERVAFVLADMFDLSFDEIGAIMDRSSTAARQLASRARRRVRGATSVPQADLTRRRELVDAFLAAARGGDFNVLVSMLAPNVAIRADRVAAIAGGAREVHGAASVANFFSGRAQAARSALVDGEVGVVVAPRGRLILALSIAIDAGKIVAFDVVGDPERLRQIELAAFSNDSLAGDSRMKRID